MQLSAQIFLMNCKTTLPSYSENFMRIFVLKCVKKTSNSLNSYLYIRYLIIGRHDDNRRLVSAFSTLILKQENVLNQSFSRLFQSTMAKLLFVVLILASARQGFAATCHYFVNNGYNCELYDVNVQTENDPLVITGSHLTGYDSLQVTSLTVFNYSMAVLHKNIFDTFPNLQSLSVFSIGLERIPALDSCQNLTTITIAANLLTTLQARVFSSCESLLFMNIHDSQLENVSFEAFHSLHKLAILELRNNQIASLDARVFDQNAALFMLDLSGNKITTLEPSIFASLVNLQILNLRQNLIDEIESTTFGNLRSLAQLDLQMCNITKIHSDAFKDLEKLQTLYLGINKLVTIEPGTFTPLISLTGVNLYNNQIKRLNSNSFGQHVNVTTFDIDLNQLDEVESNFFNRFPNLNRISAIGNVCINDDVSNMSWIPWKFEECFSNWITPRTSTLPTTSTQGAASVKISTFLVGVAAILVFMTKSR